MRRRSAELGLENDRLFKLAKGAGKIALEDPYFVEKKLYPNVDFYSGIVQKAIGIPTEMFTCIFALARTVGWMTQWEEMITDPEYKIGRPRQLYIGAANRDVVAARQALKVTRAAITALLHVPAGAFRNTADKPDPESTPATTGDDMMTQLFGNSISLAAMRRSLRSCTKTILKTPVPLPDEWRDYFDRLAQMPGYATRDVPHAPVVAAFAEQAKLGSFRPAATSCRDRRQKAVGVLQLINAYRFGESLGQPGPAEAHAAPELTELEPSYYGFTDADRMKPSTPVRSRVPRACPVRSDSRIAEETYCGSVGVEYMYMTRFPRNGGFRSVSRPIHSRVPSSRPRRSVSP